MRAVLVYCARVTKVLSYISREWLTQVLATKTTKAMNAALRDEKSFALLSFHTAREMVEETVTWTSQKNFELGTEYLFYSDLLKKPHNQAAEKVYVDNQGNRLRPLEQEVPLNVSIIK